VCCVCWIEAAVVGFVVARSQKMDVAAQKNVSFFAVRDQGQNPPPPLRGFSGPETRKHDVNARNAQLPGPAGTFSSVVESGLFNSNELPVTCLPFRAAFSRTDCDRGVAPMGDTAFVLNSEHPLGIARAY